MGEHHFSDSFIYILVVRSERDIRHTFRVLRNPVERVDRKINGEKYMVLRKR